MSLGLSVALVEQLVVLGVLIWLLVVLVVQLVAMGVLAGLLGVSVG